MDPSIAFDKAELNLQASRLTSMKKLAHATPEQARDAAEKFEGFFLSMVLETMFAGIDTNSLFGGGHGESVFRSMLLQEYGKSISEQNSLGLADVVQREILKMQEVQDR